MPLWSGRSRSNSCLPVVRSSCIVPSRLSRGYTRSGVPRVLCGLADGPRRVDEADVTERLREVAEQFPGRRVDLLGEQSQVVAVADGSLEHGPRPVGLAGAGEGFGEPERAEEEGALLAREPV